MTKNVLAQALDGLIGYAPQVGERALVNLGGKRHRLGECRAGRCVVALIIAVRVLLDINRIGRGWAYAD